MRFFSKMNKITPLIIIFLAIGILYLFGANYIATQISHSLIAIKDHV